MKVAIAYYSQHHGNTKKLLDAISEKHEVTLIDVTKKQEYDLRDFDLIGFASGIYITENSPNRSYLLLRLTCRTGRISSQSIPSAVPARMWIQN